MSATVRLAGVPVRLRGSTPQAESDLCAALSRAVPLDAPPEAEIVCDPGSVPTPDEPPTRRVVHVTMWDRPGARVVACDKGRAEISGSIARLDPVAGVVRAVHGLLLPTLSALLPTTVVHAAAFRTSDGAALLLGGTGTGKSTAAGGLLAAGATVLGDDLAALRIAAGALEVAGLPLPFALPDRAAEVGTLIPSDPRGRRVIGGGEEASEWHPVTDIVLVEHARTAAGHLLPATPREALHGVLNATLQGLHPDTVGEVFELAAVASRLPVHRLGHGTDADGRGARAAQRLLNLGD